MLVFLGGFCKPFYVQLPGSLHKYSALKESTDLPII